MSYSVGTAASALGGGYAKDAASERPVGMLRAMVNRDSEMQMQAMNIVDRMRRALDKLSQPTPETTGENSSRITGIDEPIATMMDVNAERMGNLLSALEYCANRLDALI